MGKLRFLKRIDPGHPAGVEVNRSGCSGCLPELISPFVRHFAARQWAGFWWFSPFTRHFSTRQRSRFWWFSPKRHSACSQGLIVSSSVTSVVLAIVTCAQLASGHLRERATGEPKLVPILWGLLSKSVGKVQRCE